jgi:hypothetical protein
MKEKTTTRELGFRVQVQLQLENEQHKQTYFQVPRRERNSYICHSIIFSPAIAFPQKLNQLNVVAPESLVSFLLFFFVSLNRKYSLQFLHPNKSLSCNCL